MLAKADLSGLLSLSFATRVRIEFVFLVDWISAIFKVELTVTRVPHVRDGRKEAPVLAVRLPGNAWRQFACTGACEPSQSLGVLDAQHIATTLKIKLLVWLKHSLELVWMVVTLIGKSYCFSIYFRFARNLKPEQISLDVLKGKSKLQYIELNEDVLTDVLVRLVTHYFSYISLTNFKKWDYFILLIR